MNNGHLFKTWLKPVNLAWLATVVAVIGLSTSKAALSICTVALSVAALWQMWEEKSIRGLWRDPRASMQSLLFFLPVFAIVYTEHVGLWLDDLVIKLSLLALPLAFSIVPSFSPRQFFVILAAFVLTISIISVLTLFYYFLDFAAITESIGYSKHIRIVRGTSHIHFGLMLAVSVIAGGLHYFSGRVFFHPAERIIMLIAVCINLVALHILTSRSGFIAFYGGIFFLAGLLVIRKKAYRTGALLLFLILAVPVVSYFTIPSFNTRVRVTLYDLQQFQVEKEHVSFYSIGMRIIAWKTTWRVFLRHPIIGTAPADLESELLGQYETDGVSINLNSPMHMPHNQYLEYLAGLGIVGLFALFFVLLYPIIFFREKNSMVFLSFLVMFMLIMLVESLLERQIMIAFYAIFYVLSPRMDWLD